jgi:glycosyltransferase involved in cell wall biosynthesis
MPAAPVILILTSGPLCRNPRVLKEASTLGAAGFDVTVMTIANLARFEAYDREILQTAPFKKIAINHLSSDWTGRQAALASRLGTRLARHALQFGLESANALGPACSLGRMARKFPADLTIAHTELPLYIGQTMLAHGRRVAADFEDWHSQDLLPAARMGRPLRLIRRVEHNLMQRSTYTSTTSHAMAASLQAAYGGRRPVVLTNSFPLQPDPARLPHEGLPAFFWFSQTIGPGRGLELFIAAWRQTTQPSRLCLLGDISNDYREKLIQRLAPRQRARLEFLPITAPHALPSVIAGHDIGLALEASLPVNKDCTISNKILQYFNAGLGVIASNTAGQREALMNAPGAGHIVTLSETGELVRLLDAIISDRAGRAAMGAAARHAAEQIYCWEREAPRLVATVQAALETVRPG